MPRPLPSSTLLPYTTLFRSTDVGNHCDDCTTALTLPFPVHVYDQTFSTANVGSNGNLQFASSNVDRKSTRLNSSHRCISYAVFCLKKKTDNAPAVCPVSSGV